jgi:hypothetical protein
MPFMKNIIKSALLLSLLLAGSAQAAFISAYDVTKWTKSINGGSINTSGSPNSVALTSSNNGGGAKNQDFTIAAAGNGIVSFNWNYTTTDDNSVWDSFGWLLNGVFTKLTVDGATLSQSGAVSFNVLAGNVFGFRANSLDSVYGAATTTVSNFNAPSAVPLPAAIWLMGVPLIGLMGSKRKKAV